VILFGELLATATAIKPHFWKTMSFITKDLYFALMFEVLQNHLFGI